MLLVGCGGFEVPPRLADDSEPQPPPKDSPRNSPKGPEIQTRGAASRDSLRNPLLGLEMANLYEFSTYSDAEAVLGGVVRVSVIVAPQGSLLIIRMANDSHGNQNDGCAED
jgi:hypothetical protein